MMRYRWFKVRCRNCGEVIKYTPKEDWNGLLKCPRCGNVFKVRRLEDFTLPS